MHRKVLLLHRFALTHQRNVAHLTPSDDLYARLPKNELWTRSLTTRVPFRSYFDSLPAARAKHWEEKHQNQRINANARRGSEAKHWEHAGID